VLALVLYQPPEFSQIYFHSKLLNSFRIGMMVILFSLMNKRCKSSSPRYNSLTMYEPLPGLLSYAVPVASLPVKKHGVGRTKPRILMLIVSFCHVTCERMVYPSQGYVFVVTIVAWIPGGISVRREREISNPVSSSPYVCASKQKGPTMKLTIPRMQIQLICCFGKCI
jgi:hypothetical protein